MNITKVAAAVTHFTSHDDENIEFFDSVIAAGDSFHATEVAKIIADRYSLTPPELMLFHEWCLKIVDVDAVTHVPLPVLGADIDAVKTAGALACLVVNVDAFAVLNEYTIDKIIMGEDIPSEELAFVTNLLRDMNSDEVKLLKALVATVADHVSYELA